MIVRRFDARSCRSEDPPSTRLASRTMKAPSDQYYAQNMLETQEEGFSAWLLIRRSTRQYLLLIGVNALMFTLLAMTDNEMYMLLFGGLLGGALLRDLAWMRRIKQSWPFSEKVTDWEKVRELAEG